MQIISKNQHGHPALREDALQKRNLRHAIDQAWEQIAPHWPLQNFVASNPLQGLELLPFETACEVAANQYQQSEIPERLRIVNIETIKWCLAFFDRGQATFQMPDRQLGLLNSWLELATHDGHLHQNRPEEKAWLGSLSRDPEVCIAACIERLEIPHQHYTQFMTLILTTLSGWAGHVKYCVEWAASHAKQIVHPLSLDEYLAMRLVITTLLWKEAAIFVIKDLVSVKESTGSSLKNWLRQLNANEETYADQFLGLLTDQAKKEETLIDQTPEAQIVFCIDVRSERFRQALEAQGNYETLGFAGFFGVPVEIKEYHSGKTAASCPVLISPKHTVIEIPDCTIEECERDKIRESTLRILKQCYHGMKYTFSTHFALVEAVGPWAGLWMMLKTLAPIPASFIKKLILRIARPRVNTALYIHGLSGLAEQSDLITYKDQCQYALNALRMMGLTFAPVVVLCGHGASTENNAYASALDCGACGGRHGGVNAQILAKILNNTDVRGYLNTEGIIIPQGTQFISALHNTTTDKVSLDLPEELPSDAKIIVDELQSALMTARKINTATRCANFEGSSHGNNYVKQTVHRSVDWAQTRPEWGLARNASFVVGPRWLTKNLDCQGRTFLHSYEWKIDHDGSLLTTILTAPMIVAQWINNQYLFSTFDNVAYGSGSKVTQNVAGKVGVMQGNASDLMHGLPLQSVYSNDTTQYHEPLRLLTVVYAPCNIITEIIRCQPILQKLFGNGWVKLSAIDPIEKKCYLLGRDFRWNVIE